MKPSILALLIFTAFSSNAQNLSVTLFGGMANYQGDLQDKWITTSQADYAVGAGVSYELTNKLSLRGNVTFAKIGASDSKGSRNTNRNLSFTSPLRDIHIGAEYSLLDIYETGFTPYIFAGISYFHFNPSTIDTSGKKVFLQPLGTEGQGFYDGRKKYNLNQFAIPFGGGVKLALGDNIRLGFELGLRKTNTDYLDDVSSTFADETLLLQNNGQQAVSLSYRSDELKGSTSTYPAAGTQRGNVKLKDWYYFSGITMSFRLQGLYGGGGGKSKLGCPANVR